MTLIIFLEPHEDGKNGTSYTCTYYEKLNAYKQLKIWHACIPSAFHFAAYDKVCILYFTWLNGMAAIN